jgi:hypothetical protein
VREQKCTVLAVVWYEECNLHGDSNAVDVGVGNMYIGSWGWTCIVGITSSKISWIQQHCNAFFETPRCFFDLFFRPGPDHTRMVRAALPAHRDPSAGLGHRLDTSWLSETCFGNGAFRRLPRTTKDTVTPHQFVPRKCESPTFTSTSLQKHLVWPFAADGEKTKTLQRPFSAPMERTPSSQHAHAAHYFQSLNSMRT